jgi:poly(beta-D-mannuronate) lyase
MIRRSAAFVVLMSFAATGAQAASPGDGAYRGVVECAGIGSGPGFQQNIAVIVRDGRFTLQRGIPDEDGSESLVGSVEADGRVRIEGSYRAETVKPVLYEGRFEESRLRAEGMRGPRKCKVALDGAPAAGIDPPYTRLPVIDSRRAAVGGRVAGTFVCAEPPAPLRDVTVETFYRRDDPSFSIVDPEALAARNRAAAPLAALAGGIARMGDRYLGASPRNPAVAACMAGWLDRWAGEGAMLGRVTMQGTYERKWTLATLSLNYALLADAPEIDVDTRARIEGWLRDLAWATVPEYARKPFAEQNNHLSWAALAVLAAAIATDDAALFDWGIAATRGALSAVAADGSLPRELARRSKALHYHRFALEPLVLADALAAANGIELSEQSGDALARLAAFTRDGLEDPEPIAKRAGVAQEGVGSELVSPSAYAWAEIYLARHEDEKLAAAVDRVRGRALASTWLGGNLTLRFGPAKR